MADTQNDNTRGEEVPCAFGVLAEFASPEKLIAAARQMHDRGHRRLDAFTPYPIHELDEALRIRPSILPWLALIAGVGGGGGALAFQWWTNAVDYAYIISGKPFFSWQANLPVTFEAIILAAAAAVFFGMLVLVGLPRLANPLFQSKHFAKATTDGFFLWCELDADNSVDESATASEQTTTLLKSLGATAVETVARETGGAAIPRAVYAAVALLLAVACIPPLMIARSRATTSRTPPLSSFPDMDYQPKFKAQTKTNLFADSRAMRPPVPGTVARGQLQEDDHFYRGLQPPDPSGKYRPVSMQEPAPDAQSVDPKQRPPETETQQPPEPPWARTFPIEVTDELVRRGREQFNIYCATCHGRTGAGNGPVSVRALELEQGTWIPPTSIHADYVREQPVGKLFNTITNGVRKMPGYGDQIKPRDRWAIVLYLRALQRSRNATPEDLPADRLPELRELN